MFHSVKKRVLSAVLALTILLLANTGMVAGAAPEQPEEPQLKLGVLSDLHYFPLEYAGNMGTDYQNYVLGDTRLLGESAPALDSAIQMVLDDAPDALIVTGDLTNNGENVGAQQVAQKLKVLEDNGIKVYVINGNHDIYNSEPVSFASGKKQTVSGISPSQFRAIFANYGYNGEDGTVYYQSPITPDSAAVQGALSYAVSLKSGFRLIMADSCVYTNDYKGEADAMISDELLNWIMGQIEIARQNGETPILGLHHSLVSHYSGVEASQILSSSTNILNSTIIAEKLANAGLKYVFSGHVHHNDVAEFVTRKGNRLIDASTGCLVGYGSPYRTAAIGSDDITLSSESVKTIRWQGQTIDFQQHIKDTIYNNNFILNVATRYLSGGEIDDYLKGGIKQTLAGLLGMDIDQFVVTSLGQALAKPMSEKIDAELATINVTLTYNNTANPYIRVSTNLGWPLNTSSFYPDFNISVRNNILAAINEVFAEFDSRLLAKEADGTNRLQKDILNVLKPVAQRVVYTSPDGSVKKTLNDFACEMMMSQALGGENPPAWAQQVLNGLNLDLTRAVIKDTLVPGVKSIINDVLNTLHVNINTLLDSHGMWRSTVSLMLAGDTDNRRPTVKALLDKQKIDVNAQIDKLVGEYANNDTYIGMVGQPLSALVSGVWNDTSGEDDVIDGDAVSYHIEDAVDGPASVEFDDISLGVGSDESEMYVTWYSTSTEPGVVQIAKKADKPAGADFPDAYSEFAARNLTTNIYDEFSNKAVVTGIEENTQYLYRIGNEGQWSDVYSYTTGDFDGSFNFIVAGDPQIGSTGSVGNDVSDWENTLNLSGRKFPDASFLLSLGDQVDTNNSELQYTGFLNHDVLRGIKLSTVVGNHDDGSSAYSQHFSNPNVRNDSGTSGTGREAGDYWYSHNNALFMVLNANNSNAAEHRAFLEDTISAHGGDAAWKIVAFHQSIYSAAVHSEDAGILQLRDRLAPILTDLDVDLVLMGHDHAYTRTYMMNGTTPQDTAAGVRASVTDPKAGDVLYVTLNSASSKHYSLTNKAFNYAAVKNQEGLDNISDVQVTDTSLRITTYRTESADHVPLTPGGMTVVDDFTIYKTGTPVDKTAPVLVTPGDTSIAVGSAFDPMEGVSAQDDTDGDVTQLVTVSGTVDTALPGEYRLVYSVSDAAGNSVSKVRIVTVTDGALPGITLTDIPTGITVNGRMPETSVLGVYALTGGSVYDDAIDALEEIYGGQLPMAAAYDLSVANEGQPVVLDTWNVTVPLPEGFDPSSAAVYRLTDGTPQLAALSPTVSNGVVSFSTNALGVFVVAAQQTPLPAENVLEIANANGTQGQEFTVPVLVRNTTDLAGFKARITYDKNALMLKNVVLSPELDASAFNDTVEGEVVFSAVNAHGINAQQMEIAALTFESVTGFAGTTPVAVASAEARDSSLNVVALTTVNGLVSIGGIPAPTYNVSIAPLTGGSIAASPNVAAEGATVSLVVTPDSGYQLAAGSLKYSDGTHEYAISGNTFVMPASDVTVTARFERVIVEPTVPSATNVTFTGEAVVGQTLTAQYTYVSDKPESGTTFRWMKAPHGSALYTPISGATGRTFTVTPDCAGMDIAVEVTPGNADGQGLPVIGAKDDNRVFALGDANLDGATDFMDAMLLLQALNSESGIGALDPAVLIAADANHDGSVDILDIILILRADVGLTELR